MKRTEIIRGLIKDTGLSLKAFAEKANVPYTTLYSILDRGVGNAAVDNVIKICKALGITVEELEEMANSNVTEKGMKKPTTIAAHLPEGVELTEEEQEDLDDYIQFLLSRRNK